LLDKELERSVKRKTGCKSIALPVRAAVPPRPILL